MTLHYQVWVHSETAKKQRVGKHWAPADYAVTDPAYLALYKHLGRRIGIGEQNALDERNALGLDTDTRPFPIALDQPHIRRPPVVTQEWLDDVPVYQGWLLEECRQAEIERVGGLAAFASDQAAQAAQAGWQAHAGGASGAAAGVGGLGGEEEESDDEEDDEEEDEED